VRGIAHPIARLAAGAKRHSPGWLYDARAFVERPRFYDGNPFVGEKVWSNSLPGNKSWLVIFEVEERKLTPIERTVKAAGEGWREHFEQAPNLSEELARVRQLPELQSELSDNIAKLNTIDGRSSTNWRHSKLNVKPN